MIGEDGCPFCLRVVNGEFDQHWHKHSLPRLTTVSFEPLDPVTPGHRLFLPSTHEWPRSALVAAELTFRAMHYAKEQGDDYNLILNQGQHATQSIEHMHLHYVPRRMGDGLTLPWTGQVKA